MILGSSVLFRALADASTMCASFTQYKEKPSPWLRASHLPSYADQILRVAGFDV